MNTTDINSMSFDELVPTNSKYLKQQDVGEDGVILTIRGFKKETLETDDGGSEDKIVVYWQEADYKPMVLNKTNSQLMQRATGAQTVGDAKGKQVVVYADPSVGFGGKMTGGLRVKKVSGAPRASGGAFDEEIPFAPVNWRVG